MRRFSRDMPALQKYKQMPIYMDIHMVPGVKAKDVAEAHRKDLFQQDAHSCKCMTYWIDEERENIFCLIEAPSKEAVADLHSEAHGLVPNKIIEVNSAVVESFLGRIYDPENATTTTEGLKVFHDPSFRILLVTQIADPHLLRYQLGTEKANTLINQYTLAVRNNLLKHGGREAEHQGSGFIIAFTSAAKACACALDIKNDIINTGAGVIGLKLAINSGEPVGKSNDLFGDAIQFATQLCTIADNSRIAISSSVKTLVSKDLPALGKEFISLLPQEENLLKLLFNGLEENWQDADFDIACYCRATAMSSSQLYRKTISLTGLSPNILLRDFRLEKAKELLAKQTYNIAQVTFDTGFTSASYFTKCFKKKYGLLPLTYLNLLK